MTRGRKFHREFADDRAMLCDIAGKRDMLLRLNPRQSAAQHAHGKPSGVQRGTGWATASTP